MPYVTAKGMVIDVPVAGAVARITLMATSSPARTLYVKPPNATPLSMTVTSDCWNPVPALTPVGKLVVSKVNREVPVVVGPV